MEAINLADRDTSQPVISLEEARARASQARSDYLHDCFVSLRGSIRTVIEKVAGAAAPLPGLDAPGRQDEQGPAPGVRA